MLAFGAPSGIVCSFDSRLLPLTWSGGATACAANPFVQVRGLTAASRASLTYAPPVPPRASHPRRRRRSVVSGPNGGVCRPRRFGRCRPARGEGRRNVAGASNTGAPCSTLMMTPRKATTPVHRGIHISWPASRQRSRERAGSCAEKWRKATIPLAKCPVRLMGRGRGANAAGRLLYVRAGRGSEWASTACCRSLPFSPPGTPAPLCLSLCVFLCCLRPPRCVSTGPVVVRLAGMANEREREREDSARFAIMRFWPLKVTESRAWTRVLLH